jgi:hypothetical protein
MEEEDLCAIFDDAWLGSRVWDATAALCRQVRHPIAGRCYGTLSEEERGQVCGEMRPRFEGRSVLDLGAGTGVLGLVAAAAGSAEVRRRRGRARSPLTLPAGTPQVLMTDMASPAGTVNLIQARRGRRCRSVPAL